MKRGTLNLLAGLLFFFIIIGGYYYICRTASLSAPPVVTSTAYAPINISDIKGQANVLIKARENNAGLPIPDPTAKLNKPNPFNDPE